MPIDKAELKQRIAELAGDDAELAKLFEEKLLANDTVATNFMGGYMRNRDYTQKLQALSTDRGILDQERRGYDGQIAQYRQLLEAAENEKGATMRELAQHKISVATANARLKHLKQQYNLGDDDVPDIPDQIETFQKGKVVDNSNELDKRFADFEKKITSYITDRLVPELGGMAQLDIVWADLRDEHRELTGKRMTAKESQELLNEADRRGKAGKPISLKALWEEKYDAPALREKHHDDALEKKLRQRWDDEQTAKRSEEALAGIRPGMQGQGLRTSQILEHKFKVHEEDSPTAAPRLREAPSANDRQKLSGAEIASKGFLERRAAGLPIGTAPERTGSKVA